MIKMEKLKDKIKIVHYLHMKKINSKGKCYQEYPTKTHCSHSQRIISMKKTFKKEVLKTYNKKLFKVK
jgi:hypothetical protein